MQLRQEAAQSVAAGRIQCCYRGKIGRQRTAQIKVDKVEEEARAAEELAGAAELAKAAETKDSKRKGGSKGGNVPGGQQARGDKKGASPKQMLKIAGNPPTEVIIQLNDGPAEHLHRHAFQYRQLIERELFGIRRVRNLKAGVIGIATGTLVAAMIGFFDNMFAIIFGIVAQFIDAAYAEQAADAAEQAVEAGQAASVAPPPMGLADHVGH